MLKPEKISLLRFYISQELVPVFLNDVTKIKSFHIKRSDYQATESSAIASSQLSPGRSSLIYEEEFKELNDHLLIIQNYINELLIQTKINPEKLKLPEKDKRINFNYTTPQNLVSDLLQQTEDVYFRLGNISKELEDIDQKLEEIAEIASLINIISKFGGEAYSKDHFDLLNFELYTTSRLHYKEFTNASEQLNSPIVTYGEEIGPGIIGFFVFYEKIYQKQISDLFLTYNCHKIMIPERYLNEKGINIDKIQEEHNELVQKRNHLAEIYQKDVIELPNKIMAFYEMYENAIELINVVKEIHRTPSHAIVRIEGYIPTRIEKEVISAFKNQFKTNLKIESKRINRSNPYEEKTEETKEFEISSEIEEKEVAPTLVRYPKLVRPYNVLTSLYGTSNYGEIDPAFFLAISFPIIFGLMFGDFGHGIIITLIGLLGVWKYRYKNPGTENFSWIVFYCGIGAMVGGLLYGESFGGPLYFGTHYIVLFVPPIEGANSILKLAILIGVAVLCLGWTLRFINLASNKRVFYAFSDPFLKILILIGGTYLLFTYRFDINAWFAPPEPILFVIVPSIALIFAKLVGKFLHLAPYLKKETYKGIAGESSLDFAESMLQIISNVASFIRIFALEMAHVGLMLVVSLMITMINNPGPVNTYLAKPLMLIGGNAFVIALELIIVMINCLRLHFYEFFSKFYAADGIPFKSIIIKEEFSTIQFRESPNIDQCFDFTCEDFT